MTKHKYNAVAIEVDGIRFASKAEARRYQELMILQRAGVIADLVLQPKFLLQPAFVYAGKKERAINYVGDFSFVEDDKIIVEEVKGFVMPTWLLKRKLFLYKYPHIELRVLTL